jgi:hypothetical protein
VAGVAAGNPDVLLAGNAADDREEIHHQAEQTGPAIVDPDGKGEIALAELALAELARARVAREDPGEAPGRQSDDRLSWLPQPPRAVARASGTPRPPASRPSPGSVESGSGRRSDSPTRRA